MELQRVVIMFATLTLLRGMWRTDHYDMELLGLTSLTVLKFAKKGHYVNC